MNLFYLIKIKDIVTNWTMNGMFSHFRILKLSLFHSKRKYVNKFLKKFGFKRAMLLTFLLLKAGKVLNQSLGDWLFKYLHDQKNFLFHLLFLRES